MGVNNSSICVVKPVFDEIVSAEKICQFMRIVLPTEVNAGQLVELRCEGHGGERVFSPASEYLDWCRLHPEKLVDPDRARLQLMTRPRYKFEGWAHPDVYIETTTCRVVIEAKWTEPRVISHAT